jgi:hypothetical protein
MNRNASVPNAREIMLEFAGLTGLTTTARPPQRYLWTDAFAVCNFLELFRRTHDKSWLDLALRLVGQVHGTLGRHRNDDRRTGWISGLDGQEGNLHPTTGGLRIGKPLNERGPGQPLDEDLEWDRDGQYYHYLTKWMHALNRVSRVTGDPTCNRWARELAKTAHARFTYRSSSGGRMRMYWKMSIDLSHPLVLSMGQHDPLDGFVTCIELQSTAARNFGETPLPDLSGEINDMADICRDMSWDTDDPLGIGGLLFDASRIAQLLIMGGCVFADLLETLLEAALLGLESFTSIRSLEFPAPYRLAFRELGLSIGLKAVEYLERWVEENPRLFGRESSLPQLIETLEEYVPLSDKIERFWLDERNRKAESWTGHREINMVMLATSLAPEGFLMV